jgi:hypothetical protein
LGQWLRWLVFWCVEIVNGISSAERRTTSLHSCHSRRRHCLIGRPFVLHSGFSEISPLHCHISHFAFRRHSHSHSHSIERVTQVRLYPTYIHRPRHARDTCQPRRDWYLVPAWLPWRDNRHSLSSHFHHVLESSVVCSSQRGVLCPTGSATAQSCTLTRATMGTAQLSSYD